MQFPYPFRVNQVITFCVPGEKVSWINHSMGITTQQEITFTSGPEGGTEIASLVEIVGKNNPLSWPAEKIIGHVVQQALESIREFCDRESSVLRP